MYDADVIIIGSGLGGLVAGSKLGRAGKKVLVIEQHKIPGGCATTFKRKNCRVEVGLNAMGGLDKDDIKQKIFSDLEIFNNVEFVPIPDFFAYDSSDGQITIPNNAKNAVKQLTAAFPDEARGIQKFFTTISGIRSEINRYCSLKPINRKLVFPIMPFVYPYIFFNMLKTVGSLLDSCFKSERLKSALVANMSFYHDDPYTMSLLYFSAAQGEFFQGSWFIRGGSQKLSDYLVQDIIAHGGNVLCNHKVSRILVNGGKASGVQYHPKSNPDDLLTARAGTIVANAAVPQVAESLLDRESAGKLLKQIRDKQNSCSFTLVFLRFKRPVKDLGNTNYMHFVNSNQAFRAKDWKQLHTQDYKLRPFYFCDYSQIEAGLTPDGKGQGVISMTDYLANWENLSKQEYKEKKEEVAHLFINRLENLIPGIKQEIECYEVATPKTIQRFILTPEGSVYGFAQTVKQAVPFRLSVKSPVKNLFFASAWVFPGGGFTGAIISGYTCARTILLSKVV